MIGVRLSWKPGFGSPLLCLGFVMKTLKVSCHLRSGNTRRLCRNRLESFGLLDLVDERATNEREREVDFFMYLYLSHTE